MAKRKEVRAPLTRLEEEEALRMSAARVARSREGGRKGGLRSAEIMRSKVAAVTEAERGEDEDPVKAL